MFRDPFYGRSQERTETQVMRTDIYEKDGNYLIEMDLPGYSKSDIQADLKEGYLTITAHDNETDERQMYPQGALYRHLQQTVLCR